MSVAGTQRAQSGRRTAGEDEDDMDSNGIDDILNGDKPVVEVVETPEPVQDDRPRDEHGRFLPKGEEEPAQVAEPSASPAPEIKPEPVLEHPALLGERRRRQQAEAEAEDLRAQVARFSQPKPQAAEPTAAPDMWEDPQGYADWIEERAVQKAMSRMQGMGQQSSFEARLDVSEMMAREKHADFDEKLEIFADLVKQNPALASKMQSERNPAQYAYNTAKNYSEVQQLGSLDLDAMKAKWEEEFKAKMLAETTEKLRPNLPPSLATERNVGNRGTGPAWSGPSAIKDILSG